MKRAKPGGTVIIYARVLLLVHGAQQLLEPVSRGLPPGAPAQPRPGQRQAQQLAERVLQQIALVQSRRQAAQVGGRGALLRSASQVSRDDSSSTSGVDREQPIDERLGAGGAADLPRHRRRVGRIVARDLRAIVSAVAISASARRPKFCRRSVARLAVVTIGPAPKTSQRTTAVPVAAASIAARALAKTRS